MEASVEMVKRITNARVVTEDNIISRACVEVADGVIVSVSAGPTRAEPGDMDLAGAWLVPGFIDVHVHPEIPSSLSDMRERVRELSRELLAIGTTGILWSLGGVPFEKRVAAAGALRAILEDPPDPCAVLGIHHEGPYISPTSPGAFTKGCIGTPEQYLVERLFESGGAALKYLSLSPDVPGALDVIRKCVRRGVRVGMGHSLASPEQVEAAVAAGAASIIHTFNNTPHCPMKEPGVRGVTLDEFSMGSELLTNELICDGIHVDPALVRALARAKPRDRLMIVTDSVGGGRVLHDGYEITGRPSRIVIRGGVGRNERGEMAGSALTMERAFRNFVDFTGASMVEAVRATSLNAARFLGMDRERGRIAPGFRAEFAVLDENLIPRMERLAGLCN